MLKLVKRLHAVNEELNKIKIELANCWEPFLNDLQQVNQEFQMMSETMICTRLTDILHKYEIYKIVNVPASNGHPVQLDREIPSPKDVLKNNEFVKEIAQHRIADGFAPKIHELLNKIIQKAKRL